MTSAVPPPDRRAATHPRLVHPGDGDGWVECDCGEKHWGRYGAAGLFLSALGPALLLQHRATWSHHGGTWGLPGGARHSHEDARAGALREAVEESGIDATSVRTAAALLLDHGSWSYTTVLGTTTDTNQGKPTDAESIELRWVPFAEVDELPLHPGFAASWPRLRALAGRRVHLVVDAANVLGSRPDGWWRDRAGATVRLLDQLSARLGQGVPGTDLGHPDADLWWPRTTVVVEGQAREVAEPAGLELARARGSGDDEIVRQVAAAVEQDAVYVVVVTADRELRARVGALGAGVVGPRTLSS